MHGFLIEANAELRRIWEGKSGHDPHTAARVHATDAKTASTRRPTEDGLSYTAWANTSPKALLL